MPRRALLKVVDLKTHFRTRNGLGARRRRRVAHARTGATPSASSASPARARRSCPARSWACCPASNVERAGRRPLRGHDIIGSSARGPLRALWGTEMAMVFQDPMTSLNPVMKIGRQITESLRYHLDMDKERGQARRPSPLLAVGRHPRARAAPRASTPTSSRAACASASPSPSPWPAAPSSCSPTSPPPPSTSPCRPRSSTCSAASSASAHMAMILVTHDLGVVAGRTDDIAVMYAGQDRRAGADRRRSSPTMKMPYTEALVRSIPKLDEPSHTRLDDHRRPPARPGQPARAAAASPRAARTCRTSASRRPRRSPSRARPATSTAAGSRSAPPEAATVPPTRQPGAPAAARRRVRQRATSPIPPPAARGRSAPPNAEDS